jgi:hypothetical protein
MSHNSENKIEVTKRKRYRGKWAGLSSVTISKLLGASLNTTKKLLYSLPKPVTEEHIGVLIYEYRCKKELASFSGFMY